MMDAKVNDAPATSSKADRSAGGSGENHMRSLLRKLLLRFLHEHGQDHERLKEALGQQDMKTRLGFMVANRHRLPNLTGG